MGTAIFMAYARRRRGDRQALVPCVIAIAGVLVQFTLLSRTPQPLTWLASSASGSRPSRGPSAS
ncbi:MAG: hypothetical protein ACRDND_31925 [Streptosporangiaceae bacterium]